MDVGLFRHTEARFIQRMFVFCSFCEILKVDRQTMGGIAVMVCRSLALPLISRRMGYKRGNIH